FYAPGEPQRKRGTDFKRSNTELARHGCDHPGGTGSVVFAFFRRLCPPLFQRQNFVESGVAPAAPDLKSGQNSDLSPSTGEGKKRVGREKASKIQKIGVRFRRRIQQFFRHRFFPFCLTTRGRSPTPS